MSARPRQLKIVGPSNNGKTELAQWMARMWVASARDVRRTVAGSRYYHDGRRWTPGAFERPRITFSGAARVWGFAALPLYKSWEDPNARFALVIHEANRDTPL